jgi:hypothetical protein
VGRRHFQPTYHSPGEEGHWVRSDLITEIFGLVRRPGVFATVFPTFVLVSRMELVQQYCSNDNFLITVSSSRRETMVGDSLTRDSVLRVGLGVRGVSVASGSFVYPVYSCDGWVCGLGSVVASSIFGWVRRSGAFTVVLLTCVLGSRMQLTQQYRDNDHFLIAVSSSRHKTMVGDVLPRDWPQSTAMC